MSDNPPGVNPFSAHVEALEVLSEEAHAHVEAQPGHEAEVQAVRADLALYEAAQAETTDSVTRSDLEPLIAATRKTLRALEDMGDDARFG